MSQQEVCRFMSRKNNKKRWFSTKQIIAGLNTEKTCIGTNLTNLFRKGEVERKRMKDKNKGFTFYAWKIT